MSLLDWEFTIHKAYKETNRSRLWLSACLMQEAGELAELIIKHNGYGKDYTTQQICSEAGDILNFLTAVLQSHGLTLQDAINNNTDKLKIRGWIK